MPEIIKDNGREIPISYIDNLEGKDLLIYTDKQNYFNPFGNFTAYFSVKNNSLKDQNVKVAFSFNDIDGSKKNLLSVSEYKGTELVDKVILGHAEDIISGTTTTMVVGSKWVDDKIIQEERTIWQDLPLDNFSIADIPEGVIRKDTKGYKMFKKDSFFLPLGQTKSFKAKLKYTGFKNREEFFIEAFGDKDGYGHLDPWVYEELFNSDTKTTGDLTGQDGWSGDAVFDVVSGTAGVETFEGDQSVYAIFSSAVTITNAGLSETSGVVYFAMNADVFSTTDGNSYRVELRDSANAYMGLIGFRRFGVNNRLTYLADGGWVDIAAASEDTWYIYAVEWQQNQGGAGVHQWRLKWKASGGEWSAWSGWLEDGSGTNGTLTKFILYGDPGFSVYFDTITPDDPTVGGEAARGFLSTNTKFW